MNTFGFFKFAFLAIQLSAAWTICCADDADQPDEELDYDAVQLAAVKEVEALIASKARVTLFSLDLHSSGGDQADDFGDYAVLGKIEITDPEDRKLLLGSLLTSIRSSQGEYACFNPRHGLRFSNDDAEVDLAICFECGKVFTSGLALSYFRILESGDAVFNDFLDRHKIPRDKE